jgi:5-methylcytosine-specific restriction endonuclease McrA
VNQVRPKQPRLRLDPPLYEQLRNQVLHRDGWRCQSCGTRSNLEVHHKEFRSHSGDDSEENLITLCTPCHDAVHRGAQAYHLRGGRARLAVSRG